MFSLFEILRRGYQKPFRLASDPTQIYRLERGALEKKVGQSWENSTDQFDPNAKIFERDDSDAYRLVTRLVVRPMQPELLVDGQGNPLVGEDLANKILQTGFDELRQVVTAEKI